MKVDFAKFQGSLPYASEMYGVYQPLLGWRSARIANRFRRVAASHRRAVAQAVVERITPSFSLPGSGDQFQTPFRIDSGAMAPGRPSNLPTFLEGAVGAEVVRRLEGTDPGDVRVWDAILSDQGLGEILRVAEERIRTGYAQIGRSERADVLVGALAHESQVAGALKLLHTSGRQDVLQALFTAKDRPLDMSAVVGLGNLIGVGERAGPPTAALSPIGVVHLFRQYFFEFDSFLGTPVQHVWLSPGGTVELVEISTRRTLTERTTEQAFESIQKSEKTDTLQDELADAVKQENQNTTKFGVSAESTSNLNLGIFSTQLTARTTFDSEEIKKTAKEQTHKQLRQQTTKLSTEIKQSFKSTFRTVVENTDTSSKRYLLQNNTDKLLNYELRRKMRQVGVQIQDLGTQLCWQAYVDRPGDELGLAKLVHIAKPPETNVQPAQMVPAPEEYQDHIEGTYKGPDDDSFDDGLEDLTLHPKHGFTYKRHEPVQWLSGNSAALTITQDGSNLNLLHLRIQGHSEEEDMFPYRFTVVYEPTDGYLADLKAENDKRIAAVEHEKERLAKEAFFQAARDRVKAASNIQPRTFGDLREEERIIVYRGLIRQLFHGVGLSTVDAQSQHLLAELVQSLFDVDRMLYFVAPEWWVPRSLSTLPHASPQNLGFSSDDSKHEFEQRNIVDWGGVKGNRPDNYYITEDSSAARLGSSLGWVLQLDGDSLRSAFLNAPWVKAVVPIRPGREMQALDWLTNAGVEGSDGLDDLYQEAIAGERAQMLATLKGHNWTDSALTNRYAALASTGITIHDAIRYLAVVVTGEFDKSRAKVSDTLPDSTPINYLPADKVYERGFDPLKDGFEAAGTTPFQVFDQWIEVMPTDQIVPVEVQYDPKTGMQI